MIFLSVSDAESASASASACVASSVAGASVVCDSAFDPQPVSAPKASAAVKTKLVITLFFINFISSSIPMFLFSPRSV